MSTEKTELTNNDRAGIAESTPDFELTATIEVRDPTGKLKGQYLIKSLPATME